MRKIVAVLGLCYLSLTAQETKKVRLEFLVLDELSNNPLSGVVVAEDSLKLLVKTNHKGFATLRLPINGNYQLHFHKESYERRTKDLVLSELPLVLDTILMRSNPIEYDLAFVFNESSESFFDGVDDSQSSYLSIGRDIFDRKAAFDWGSSFFNRRGLKTISRNVLINGLKFNSLYSGGAQWAQWGGLNDFFRNQEQSQPLEFNFNSSTKGRGITSIDLNPFLMRKAKRVSSSISDKSYQGRLMLSMIDEPTESFRYGLGGSFRLGTRGYQMGTPYQSYSYTAHIAKQWNTNQLSSLHYFRTFRENAKSSALSKEVVDLLGRDYNPNWGYMSNDVRSSKTSSSHFKTLLLTHQLNTVDSNLKATIMAQNGATKRTRLHYDTAESPDPIYYKKLPSYYINSFLGANFYAANSAKKALLNHPQINWEELYTANRLHPALVHYALVADVEFQNRWATALSFQTKVLKDLTLSIAIASNNENFRNFARAEDLLGGFLIKDMNPFDKGINDLNGPLYKKAGEAIQYAYKTQAKQYRVLPYLNYESNRWMISLAFEKEYLTYQREREMVNQRFETTPLKHSQNFRGLQKSFMSRYGFDARNYIEAYWIRYQQPVSLSQYFVNPNENNRSLEASSHIELADLIELSYVMRWRNLSGRIQVYAYNYNQLSSHRPYYVHTSFGSVFVQEITTDVSTIHRGIEGSFNLKVSPVVELEGAFSIGNYKHTNNPHLELELINDIGVEGVKVQDNRIDLGESNLKGYQLGNGPSSAYSLSLSYRDPHYWFSSLSFNRIDHNYIGVTPIRFTDSFLLRKENQFPAELFAEELQQIKEQELLEGYFVTNFLFGKSYLKNGRYTSVFLSVDNVLGSDFKSGGYESSRFGNYQDYLKDQQTSTPLFPTKYWWSSSRRFFLNLTISLP